MGDVDRLLGRVSILVVVERGGGRQATAVDADLGRLFQSLLLWNGGADLRQTRGSSKRRGFNPCCCGTGGRTASWGSSARCIARFQSLLLWNGGADGKPAKRSSASANVSILVVVERGGGREAAWRPPSRPPHVSILVVVERGGGRSHGAELGVRIEFQSLLLWNGGADIRPSPGLPREVRVSILVVVERGGGRASRRESRPGQQCFNPCCCGTGGRTKPLLILLLWQRGFQSLLLWNGGADKAAHEQAIAECQFQSLLLWNGGADDPQRADHGTRRDVSILVVVERGGGQLSSRPTLSWLRMFQSLLLWNGGADRSRTPRPRAIRPCFNPCCCGTGGRTSPSIVGFCASLQFQSLLLWNGGADCSAGKSARRTTRFQSLLLWNGGADGSWHAVIVGRRAGFNPCCCGTGGRTPYEGSQMRKFRMFQSLLLWNGGADRITRPRRPMTRTSFNPCCCGTGGRTVSNSTTEGDSAVFQSLLLWNGGADAHVRAFESVTMDVSILVVVERGGGRSTPSRL